MSTIAYYKNDPRVMGNITIKDHVYALESCLVSPGDHTFVAISLTKQSDPDDQYTVYRSNDGDLCLSGNTNAGWECDCPDYLNRHAGQATLGCKHIQAIVAETRLVEWMTDREQELNGPSDEELAEERRLEYEDARFAHNLCR